MLHLAMIGLGSNLGDRKTTLDNAVSALSATPEIQIQAVSSYHETSAIGGPAGQGAFLNAAAAVETSLSPLALHQILQKIEHDAGRVRKVRWGERTLDLDLLLFDQEIINTPGLTVPHPRMGVRRFVLAGLAEIAPSAVDPLTGQTIANLLANLDRRPSHVQLAMNIHNQDMIHQPQTAFQLILETKLNQASSSESDQWIITQFGDTEYGDPTFLVVEEDLLLETLKTRHAQTDSNQQVSTFPYPILQVRGWLANPQDQDMIVSDILSACEASRAGCSENSHILT